MLKSIAAKLRQSTDFFLLVALAAIFLVLALSGNAFSQAGAAASPVSPTEHNGGVTSPALGIVAIVVLALGGILVLVASRRQ